MWEKKNVPLNTKYPTENRRSRFLQKATRLGVFRTLMNASDIRLKCHV